jgi:hypothetical protein
MATAMVELVTLCLWVGSMFAYARELERRAS